MFICSLAVDTLTNEACFTDSRPVLPLSNAENRLIVKEGQLSVSRAGPERSGIVPRADKCRRGNGFQLTAKENKGPSYFYSPTYNSFS